MIGAAGHMESMWRDFPVQLLESKVLTFLPIASLCRFRTVSKKWNKLISHDRFFASSHARASSSESDYVLITMRVDRSFNPICAWEVLDVVNKKFFTLSDDFLAKYAKQQEEIDPDFDPDLNSRAILAADGGLLCLSYDYKVGTSVLLVCNPVLKTAKQLPNLPEWADEYASVVMSTDRISMEYEIFVFNIDDNHYRPNGVYIYESRTGTWRTVLSDGPPLRKPGRWWHAGSNFVKLGRGFYKIFQHNVRLDDPTVVCYNKSTGVASDLRFALPRGDHDNANLVVSKDRLFWVTMKGDFMSESEDRSVEIFEVILDSSRECKRWTEMPSTLLDWVLGEDLSDNCSPASIVSTGCANSILICSCVGRSVACSLSDKSWQKYPDNNLFLSHDKNQEFFGWFHPYTYGCNNSLSLCPP